MISVLILTRDEEANLPACLDAVKWSDDIIVFDSYSTDRTVDIARARGARVIQRRFDNELAQRTAARHLDFKYPWVFNPDADEIPGPELCDEMRTAVKDTRRNEVAYRVRFKTIFMDRWIKHSSLYPTWIVRLFRPDRIRLEREVNLRYCIDGAEGRLQHHLLHYTFRKGLDPWIAKHCRYAQAEAHQNIADLANTSLRDLAGVFKVADPVGRRRALKLLSMRLPCRPTLRFLYMYLLRRGFLDGRAGLTYCRLMAFYEYLIVLNMRSLSKTPNGP